MGIKVAVVGAGALGLSATKTFKEDGFSVTTYESREHVGGLWKDTDDSLISVHGSTIFNSSKYRSGLSDFPFADTDDDYPTANQLHAWLERYVRQFELLPCIRLGTKVLRIQRKGQKWELTIQNNKTGETATEEFDKVCIATGSFYTPRWPKLAGLEKFEGNVIHSVSYHDPEPYKDQNVLLVGMHATAQDVTHSLAKSAKHVYLSHRGGLLLLPRFNKDGSTFDAAGTLMITLFTAWMTNVAPKLFFKLMDSVLQKASAKAYPNIPKEWGLHPPPSVAVSTPLMADTLWEHLESRFAEPVAAIRRITGPRSVELENGRILNDIDSIIYCTGYNFDLPDGLIPKTDEGKDIHPYPDGSWGQPPRLYRNIFPLHQDESIRNSLAIMGQAAIIFPGFVQWELNNMAVSQIWKGNSSLPSYDEMLRWRERHLSQRKAAIATFKPKDNSTFYPAVLNTGDHLRWVDETAGTGIYQNFSSAWYNPRAWKLWRQDKELYYLCTRGLFTPTIWRLFETGKRKAMPWEECRAMIVHQNELAEEAKKRRVESVKAKQTRGNKIN